MPKCQTKIFMLNALKKRQISTIWHEKRQYGNPAVSRTFPSCTFRGMQGSEKNFFRKSSKTKSFLLQQMKGIQYSISTQDVG